MENPEDAAKAAAERHEHQAIYLDWPVEVLGEAAGAGAAGAAGADPQELPEDAWPESIWDVQGSSQTSWTGWTDATWTVAESVTAPAAPAAPLRSHPEEIPAQLQRLRLQMERAWPETSVADAFVNFAGKGSDTLYVGIFARVANDLGLTTEESTAIFRILSGNKSFVQLEDWDGLLLGAVQIAPQVSNVAQQPPAPPNVPEDDLGDLMDSDSEETSTESTTPGSSECEVEASEATASSPEEEDESLTQQRNDLRALVQVLQAQLKLSQEETNGWQREAHRQEEAATELREKIRLTQVWGTIGSVQALIKSTGIGFIRPYSGPVNGKDLFFHKSELKNGNFHTLAIGDEVSYEVNLNPVNNRTFAANVMLTERYS